MSADIMTIIRRAAMPVALTLLAVAGGCQSSDCLDLRSSIPQAGFYASYNKTLISLDSLSIGGVNAPNDSLLLRSGTPASGLYLPLRSAVPSTSFYIHYGYPGLSSDEFNDTLTLTYTSIPYFVSQECGAMYRYRIDRIDYTRHLIDSIGCRDSLITNVDTEWLQIYFKIAEPDAPDTPGEIQMPEGGAR